MNRIISALLSLILVLTTPASIFAVETVATEADNTEEQVVEEQMAEDFVGTEDIQEPQDEEDTPEAEPETDVTIANSVEDLTEKAQAAEGSSYFTIDVRKGCKDLATEALTDEVSDVLAASGRTQTKQDKVAGILEDSGYYMTAEAGKSKLEVTSLYANQRLRLDAPYSESLNTYGAEKAVFYEDHYFLTYRTEADTKGAYEALVKEYGSGRVTLDIPIKFSAMNWGTSFTGMDSEKEKAAAGSPVVVAVLDTGISRDHDVFQGTDIKDGYDFVNNDSDTSDDSGHGTAVAGIVAEATPANVSILPVKILDSNGEGGALNLFSGLEYALEHGADIVNISLGAFANSETQFAQLQKRFSASMAKGNALAVCASGNEGTDMDGEGIYQFPGELKDTVCVGAFGEDEAISDFSNYGSAVDFSAPGDDLELADNSDGTYSSMSGTSFAAPYIAAAAALIKAEDDSLSPDGIVDALKETSKDMGEEGKDVYFGDGCPTFSSEEPQEEEPQDPFTDPVPVDGAEISVAGSVVYTGKELKPALDVKLDGLSLAEGVDYNAAYKDNINAGTATVTITGIGKYTGTASQSFAILPQKATPEILLSKTSFTYNGAVQKPDVAVRCGDMFLEKDRDYMLEAESGANAGTYEIKVRLTGNYEGETKGSFTIAPKEIVPLVMLSETSYVYDGKVKTPAVTVKNGNKVLSSEDYDVSYGSGRISAGTYSVVITLKRNYAGTARTSFVITPDASTPVMKLSNTSYNYDGRKKYPDAVVTAGSTELKKGIDYDLKYPDARADAGTYTVMADLKGNYKGVAEARYTILPKRISPELVLSESDYTYDGEQKTPNITIKDGSTVLSENRDYTLSFDAGRVKAGTYTVRATLSGNYSGEGSATYIIRKAENTLSASGKKPFKVNYKALRKKAQKIKITRIVTKKGGVGKVTYTKLTGSRKILVNKKTGMITVKKGLAKGTYRVQINIRAAGNENYSVGSKTVICRLKVR